MEKDNDGATPLHFAAARGIRTYITSYIYNVPFVATLKYAISMYGTSMVWFCRPHCSIGVAH